MAGYQLIASPTLHEGQTIKALVIADEGNRAPVNCGLYISAYGANDDLYRLCSPATTLQPGISHHFEWTIRGVNSDPVAEVGIELRSETSVDGTVYLDWLTWHGAPQTDLTRSSHNGTIWRRAWVNAIENV